MPAIELIMRKQLLSDVSDVTRRSDLRHSRSGRGNPSYVLFAGVRTTLASEARRERRARESTARKIRAGLEGQCDRQVLPGKIQPQRTTTAAGKGFAMIDETRFEYLTSEQTEILRAIKRMETAFELAGDKDFSKRIKGLLELRTLEHAYDGIAEHCHSEERIVESTFRHYASKTEYSQIVAGHSELLRLLYNFREELEFATADSTTSLIPLCKELVGRIREHIGFEKELLERTDSTGPVPEKVLMRYTESPE